MSKIKPIDEKKRDHLARKTRLDENGCLIWTGPVDRGGYGEMKFENGPKRVTFRAHRAAYEVACGPIPNGMFVCHTCDVPLCCNPEHLFLGSHQDNMDDMARKGRGRRAGQSEKQEEVLRLLMAGRPSSYIRRKLGVSSEDVARRALDLWQMRERLIRCEAMG
jgi:hypothetical protein